MSTEIGVTNLETEYVVTYDVIVRNCLKLATVNIGYFQFKKS